MPRLGLALWLVAGLCGCSVFEDDAPPPAPTGPKEVEVPFHRTKNGALVLQAGMNGNAPAAFVLSTTADQVLVLESQAKKWGIGQVEADGHIPTTKHYWVRDMACGAMKVHNVRCQIIADASVSKLEKKLGESLPNFGGMLGYSFLSSLTIFIDFAGEKIALHEGSTEGDARLGDSTGLTFYVGGGQARHSFVVFKASVRGKEPDPFVLDLASHYSVLMPRAARELGVSPMKADELEAAGLPAGKSMVEAGPLKIGEHVLEHQPMAVVDLTRDLGYDISGMIGTDVIERWTLVLDYPRGRLFLLPPSKAPAPKKT